MRSVAEKIYTYAIAAALPDAAVKEHLATVSFAKGDIIVISVGKAGWTMASAAVEVLGNRIQRGLVLTKYHHSHGQLPGFEIMEAGHPIPDENPFRGTRRALELTQNLRPEDTVLFLLSGGGSALFELSELDILELQDINSQLIGSGAGIQEINTVRKRLSRVKGGRFAEHCAPAKVVALLLSDVLGNQPDMIASGPVCVDATTCAQAIQLVEKYKIRLSEKAKELLRVETPKELPDVTCHICGDVLANNDAYHALEKCGGLIVTGATGTNVNDVAVVLIKEKTKERKYEDHEFLLDRKGKGSAGLV